MVQHRLPFENRWTTGDRAWHWHCQLERIGIDTVRTMYADHECHHPADQLVVADVPPQFVRDWLAFHDRHAARRQMLWRSAVIVLVAVGAGASLYSALW
ncbi:MAG: hypothetical protein J0J01_19770 [Reyranella sp.]|uniref:hypothetical protein n=1 Tax=Reyranella sp. TaxID=1929291 RepID=UPI001ACE35EE|nr:hypothetical protein [Reyranella sp.]MBN9089151.1 hypothetical protein [Reyranella sp.]